MAGKIGEGSIKAMWDRGRDEIAQHMLGQPATVQAPAQAQAPQQMSYAAAVQEQREMPRAPAPERDRSR